MPRIVTQPYEDRRHPRVEVNFVAELSKEGLAESIEAITYNVSQGGGHISKPNIGMVSI